MLVGNGHITPCLPGPMGAVMMPTGTQSLRRVSCPLWLLDSRKQVPAAVAALWAMTSQFLSLLLCLHCHPNRFPAGAAKLPSGHRAVFTHVPSITAPLGHGAPAQTHPRVLTSHLSCLSNGPLVKWRRWGLAAVMRTCDQAGAGPGARERSWALPIHQAFLGH